MKTPQRYAFKIDADFKFGEAGDTLRKFLFSYDGEFITKFRGYNVFWLRGWIRILGFSTGVGIFIQFFKLADTTTEDSEGI